MYSLTMDIHKLILPVFGCLIISVSVASEYRVIRSIHDRTKISDSCRLASPNKTARRESASTAILAEDTLNDGEKAWIGYAMDFQVFQYIGCVREKDIREKRVQYKEVETSPGPGYCSGACADSPMFGIGLREKTCFCFHAGLGEAYDRRWECDSPCNNDDFACGGRDVLSVYKKVSIPMDAGHKPYSERCLLYEHDDDVYSWKNCTEKHSVACTTDQDPHVLLSADIQTWRYAADKCFHDQSYPLSYNVTLGLSESVWTSLIQTMSVFKLPVESPSSRFRQFGYVERKGLEYRLKFTDNKTLTNTAICVNDMSDVINGSMATAENGGSFITADDGSNNKSTDVGLYVGVPIGILLVVALLIAMIIVWRKRELVKDFIVARGTIAKNDTDITDNAGYSNADNTKRNEVSLATMNVTYEELHNDKPSLACHACDSDRNDLANTREGRDVAISPMYEDTYAIDNVLKLPTLRQATSGVTENGSKAIYVNALNKETDRDSHIYNNTYYTLENVEPQHDIEDKVKAYSDVYDYSVEDNVEPGHDRVNKGNVYSDVSCDTRTVADEHDVHTYNRTCVGTPDDNVDTYDHIGDKGPVEDARMYDKLPTQNDIDQTYDSTSSVPVKYKGENIYSHTHVDNGDYSTLNQSSKLDTQNVYGYS